METKIKEHIIVKFKQWNCQLTGDIYTNSGRKAIQLIDITDGSPVATATVNLPDWELREDQVFIKEYSENEGMGQCLADNDIISKIPSGIAYSGHVTIFKYTLTQKGLSLWKQN